MIDINNLAFVNKKYSLIIFAISFCFKAVFVTIREEALLKVINPIYWYQSSSSGMEKM